MAAQQLAVNVVDFAKARLPELEALDEELDKNNRDAPRHLRRRARSHTAPFLAKKNPNNPNPTRRARRADGVIKQPIAALAFSGVAVRTAARKRVVLRARIESCCEHTSLLGGAIRQRFF